MTYPDTQLFIDGRWQDAGDGRTLPVVNPATGHQIGRVARAARADLDRALSAAHQGYLAWRDTTAAERSSGLMAGRWPSSVGPRETTIRWSLTRRWRSGTAT